MTDHIDYTQRPEVLNGLGWHKRETREEWHDSKGCCRGTIGEWHWQSPTMQELWEGLNRVWEARPIDPLDDECHHLLKECRPKLDGMLCVVLFEPGEIYHFTVKEYGTLSNAIAAAIMQVLSRV